MHVRPTAWRIIGNWLGRHVTFDPAYQGLVIRLPWFGLGAQWSWWGFRVGASWGVWPTLYLGFIEVEFWRDEHD